MTCVLSDFLFLRSEMKDDEDLAGLDETQVKLMEEECILVDKNDQVIGSASKKVCHLLNNIDKGIFDIFGTIPLLLFHYS